LSDSPSRMPSVPDGLDTAADYDRSGSLVQRMFGGGGGRRRSGRRSSRERADLRRRPSLSAACSRVHRPARRAADQPHGSNPISSPLWRRERASNGRGALRLGSGRPEPRRGPVPAPGERTGSRSAGRDAAGCAR
jgi:hypothetical protein